MRPAGSFEVVELQFGELPPDPARPMVWQRLAKVLGLQTEARVQRLQGFSGGLNEGVWIVSDSLQDIVLKLVRYKRGGDGDRIAALSQNFPEIQCDNSLAFPIKVLRCCGPDGRAHSDIIAMPRAPGQPLNDIAAQKFAMKKVPEMMQIFERLGAFLADFHKRYGNCQHGDFQATNVFYSEATDCFTMIDVADIGPRHQKFATDEEHFVRSIGLLAMAYGEQFELDGVCHFKAGYGASSGEQL